MAGRSLVGEIDGRHARSERSKQAIIDAGFALLEEGVLVPTAQQISERAGVGLRSFFRHFDDMEAFFLLIHEQRREVSSAHFASGPRDGTVKQRIAYAVTNHADGFESDKNIILSTTALAWRFDVLRTNYGRCQRHLRKDLDARLPELGQLSRSQREAVDAIISFEMWHRLRHHQGLSIAASTTVIIELLTGLVPSD